MGIYLRKATIKFGLWGKEQRPWGISREKYIVFDQIIITPRNAQYQIMRFASNNFIWNTSINYRPDGYQGWLDRTPKHFDYGSMPNNKITEFYTDDLLQEMSLALQWRVTSPNQSATLQGIWYVVEIPH